MVCAETWTFLKKNGIVGNLGKFGDLIYMYMYMVNYSPIYNATYIVYDANITMQISPISTESHFTILMLTKVTTYTVIQCTCTCNRD